MYLNTQNTEVMAICNSNDNNNNSIFQINGSQIETVSSIKYLGDYLNANWAQTKDILLAIEKARNSFIKLITLLCNMKFHLQLVTASFGVICSPHY